MEGSYVGFFSQRTHPIHPIGLKLLFWTFQTVTLLNKLWCKKGRTGAINALVRATKSRQNCSQRTHPIRPIGPQTHVFVRFGPFRYYTNFDTKWAELLQLMHKLRRQSRFRIFHNKRTGSTLFDPKLMFGGVSDRLLLLELPCKKGRTGAINAQVRATKSRQNFLRRTHPIYPIRPEAHVFSPFGPFSYYANFGVKHAELVQLAHKFVQ
jgi:hypothetical protein